MLDLVYTLITVVFFALMLWYVRGCALLGPSAVNGDEERHT